MSFQLFWFNFRLLYIYKSKTNYELFILQDNLKRHNGIEFNYQPKITQICFSDAGKFASGEYIVENLGSCSSTYIELLALKNVFISVAQLLEAHTVQWFSDNTIISRTINFDSMHERTYKI